MYNFVQNPHCANNTYNRQREFHPSMTIEISIIEPPNTFFIKERVYVANSEIYRTPSSSHYLVSYVFQYLSSTESKNLFTILIANFSTRTDATMLTTQITAPSIASILETSLTDLHYKTCFRCGFIAAYP